jgi:hypothetical protein
VRESVARATAQRKPETLNALYAVSAKTTAFCTGSGLAFSHLKSAVPVATPRSYKGFILTARTFQVRGSGQWTLDVIISRRGSLRAFSSPTTFGSERDATNACMQMGCKIIDASPKDCHVSDLTRV